MMNKDCKHIFVLTAYFNILTHELVNGIVLRIMDGISHTIVRCNLCNTNIRIMCKLRKK